MYINKVVFVEYDERTFKGLKEYGLPHFTDYETQEITSDMVQNIIHELKQDESMATVKVHTFVEALSEALGSDVADVLIKGEIDFVQVVWG